MRQVPEKQAFDVRSLSRLTTWRKKEQNEIRLQPSRLTSPSVGFLSSSDPRVHFGLGNETKAATIEIRWPGGATLTVKDVAADQILTLHEPSAGSK